MIIYSKKYVSPLSNNFAEEKHLLSRGLLIKMLIFQSEKDPTLCETYSNSSFAAF
jgi:hypothetical protein